MQTIYFLKAYHAGNQYRSVLTHYHRVLFSTVLYWPSIQWFDTNQYRLILTQFLQVPTSSALYWLSAKKISAGIWKNINLQIPSQLDDLFIHIRGRVWPGLPVIFWNGLFVISLREEKNNSSNAITSPVVFVWWKLWCSLACDRLTIPRPCLTWFCCLLYFLDSIWWFFIISKNIDIDAVNFGMSVEILTMIEMEKSAEDFPWSLNNTFWDWEWNWFDLKQSKWDQRKAAKI